MIVRGRENWLHKSIATAIAVACLCLTGNSAALAQRIENGTAVFAALDKVTARISRLEVKLGETARFGALKLTPRACYSRAPTEPPKTTTFIEVQEILLDGTEKRLFNGWMFAESPGLNAVEHPVFDVWLTECTQPVRPAAGVAQKAPAPAATGTKKGDPAPVAAPPRTPAFDPGSDSETGERRRRPPR